MAAEAQRTLVKSPPELWAELSDPGALARHLGAFGEIRITRTQPETAISWEGECARGTVELEPAGWGTRVRITAAVTPPPAAAPAPARLRVVGRDRLRVEVPVPAPEPEKTGVFKRMFGRTPAPAKPPPPEILEIPIAFAECERPAPPPPGPPAVDAEPVLSEMLDTLGAAHHRPFSRG